MRDPVGAKPDANKLIRGNLLNSSMSSQKDNSKGSIKLNLKPNDEALEKQQAEPVDGNSMGGGTPTNSN